MSNPAITDPHFVEKMGASREKGWTSEQYDLIDAWRARQGEVIMDDWTWWAGPSDDAWYDNQLPTREAAIEWGRKEYANEPEFQIIEARCWTDDLVEDEATPFAATRNHEIVSKAAAS